MIKRTLAICTLLFIVTGCASFEYGYSSLDYEGKLVNLNSSWGKKRLNQIVGFDNSAMNLVSLGYNPSYLYEVSDDDYYFISGAGSYHLNRGFLETDSVITKVSVIPSFIQSELDKYGIALSPPELKASTEKPSESVLAESKKPSISQSRKLLISQQAPKQATVKLKPAVVTPKKGKAVTAPKVQQSVDAAPQKQRKSIADPRGVLSAVEIFEMNNPLVHRLAAATVNKDSEVVTASSGSGVMLTPNHMVTNYHVIEGHNFVITRSIKNPDSVSEWNIVKTSKQLDLAILHNSTDHPHVKKYQRLKDLKIGQKVFAIGSPETFENTLSEGLISGKRTIKGNWLIQTTADITHGSSGGALFSDSGDLIGITSSGFGNDGNLNFAIPIDSVEQLIQKK